MAEHAGKHHAVDTSNIETHFTVIAVLELIVSIPIAILGAAVFFGVVVGAGFAESFGNAPGIGALIASAGLFVGLVFIAMAVPGIVSAIGLLQRQSWAKIWTIVAGALSLLNVPIGTLFGAYAIWAMTREETDAALH
jgi:hypothetical protein